MQAYAFLDENDCVATAGMAAVAPIGAMLAPNEFLKNMGTLARCYLSEEGEFLPRPVIPVDEPDGGLLTIPPLPLGTRVIVGARFEDAPALDMVTDVEGWTETLQFAHSGHYNIEIAPPAPWQVLCASFEVTV